MPDADLPAAYRAADLSVVPSISLGGIWSYRVGVFGRGNPGPRYSGGRLPEVVSGLSKDLVLDGSSAAQLAEGIVARLRYPDNLPSDTACQAYAKENFDWPVIAKRVLDVYKNALQKSLIEQ